ncbi:multidrug resistance protein ABC transporter family protein [Parasponia andersonii]|uniref:Multidrug resistance protein ABC transporter family protein n=1 Tax=Parasponia andersonii TaxID=3476 RepID=A0A2P5CKY6_PARAD|nr:multidrug resistance protein ABC transporter family protein [Parasponia andersonii]
MGNSVSHKPPSHGKVILWDGSVHEFEKPLTAAELMLDHPQHAVVEFQSAVTGKRPTPLPADRKLETKKIYMMVPIRRGKAAALSTDEIHRVLLIANSVLRTRSVKFLPLFARICPADYAGIGVSVAKKEKKIEQTIEEKTTYVPVETFLPESLDGTPEYLSRQFSGKGWKPSLDTIEEKVTVERKVSHWLF